MKSVEQPNDSGYFLPRWGKKMVSHRKTSAQLVGVWPHIWRISASVEFHCFLPTFPDILDILDGSKSLSSSSLPLIPSWGQQTTLNVLPVCPGIPLTVSVHHSLLSGFCVLGVYIPLPSPESDLTPHIFPTPTKGLIEIQPVQENKLHKPKPECQVVKAKQNF